MFSPDGRWRVYESDEAWTEIYVRQYPAGGKWQVSAAGGSSPVWSRKRQELFFRTPDGIMQTPYRTTDGTFELSKPRLWAAKKGFTLFDVAPSGDCFAIVDDETTDPTSITRVALVQNFSHEVRQRASEP